MGKALLIASAANRPLADRDEFNLFGSEQLAATESHTQASCTEAATFSALGANIISGNSGTATFRFRDEGANGNQVVAITGATSGEDTTNTDALSAADLFNLSYTDTGTDSTISWVKGNVEFSSGHGNFHGSADYGQAAFDAASSTRFIPLCGDMINDGFSTENLVEWKVRGYDSFEALQVRVSSNARTNDSVFRNRIANGNGSGVCTFAGGATGLVTSTGLGDAITDGPTVNASITLDTGIEDLVVTFVLATLKSSSSK